jgi:hypothetical protein
MAESAAAGDPTQLYTAIEKAYCEDRWSDVLEQGERLLARLPGDDLGLRQRLELLMAHTYLYGFGDRAAAAGLYRSVERSQAESALRQIAAQGLQQCDVPMQPQADALPRPAEAEPLLEETGPSLHEAALALSQAELGQTTAADPAPAEVPAMPWLDTQPAGQPAPATGAANPTAAVEPALIPEVIEEPELIEVHQADPNLAEELELKEPSPQRTSDWREDDEDPELRKGLLRVEIP